MSIEALKENISKLMEEIEQIRNTVGSMPRRLTGSTPFETLPLEEMACLLRFYADAHDILDRVTIDLGKYETLFKEAIIPNKMQELNITSIKVQEVGRLDNIADMRVSIADDKEAANDWLRNMGLGDLIKETVNAASLKSSIRELYMKGELIPEDLFKLTPIQKIKLTRSK